MDQRQSDLQCLTINSREKKVIYDFGSNNGDDVPYYLKKSDTVIAVEANPVLCEQIENRFKEELSDGRLFVENCVLTTDDSANEVYFYIHKSNHVLSQFPKPENTQDFEKVLLPSKSVMQLIKKYGNPYYIKIDIEHYDQAVLRALFENNVRPPYISAESHDIEVFSLLVSLGRYNSFKLVDGYSVSSKYNEHKIVVNEKTETYSFPFHSAGPFGDDISGEWMTANNFYRLLAFENLGWKDIHASSLHPPNPTSVARMAPYVKVAIQQKILSFIPAPIKRIVKRIVQIKTTR
jgi:FkbM family methyltransferase